MAAHNSTIVLVAGAATPVELYSQLQRAIESTGLRVVCGDPPSITADDATTITVEDDVKFLRESVLHPCLAEGQDVVLLMHSYGGTYGAAAAQGLSKKERSEQGKPGGIVGLIYAASFCTNPGESALDALGAVEGLGTVVPGDKPGTLIFSDPAGLWTNLTADEAKLRIGRFQPCAVGAIGTPISYAPYQDSNYHGVIAYVAMKNDKFIPQDKAEGNIQKSGIKLVKWLEGGHGIDVEATEEIVKTVEELKVLLDFGSVLTHIAVLAILKASSNIK
ncbi:hypothetical protein HJFPF1_04558 [Paramyrothecium foliicola]|nr:hypothetical protein HJFPF1_04558 [Paramyrothecium foliicola]